MKKIRPIIYAVTAIAVLAIAFFVISLAYTSYKSFSAQSAETRVEELQAKDKEIMATHQKWNQFEQTFGEFKTEYLLESAKFRNFSGQLQMMLRKSALNPGHIKPNIKIIFSDVLKLSLNFEAKGSYEGFKRFVQEMENRKDMVIFKSIRLKKSKSGMEIEGKISMEVYFAAKQTLPKK